MKKNLVPSKKASKIFLVILVFLFSLVLAVPQFPVKFSWKNFSIDRVIGGYQMNLPFIGTFPSSKFYLLGEDFFSINLVVLRPAPNKDIGDSENLPKEDLERAQQILLTRLKNLEYGNAKISFQEEPTQLTVQISTDALLDKQVAQALTQPAKIFFKQLGEEIPWNEENLQFYYLNPDVWEGTKLDSENILGAVVSKGDLQLILSEEGHVLFKEIALANIDKPLGIFLDDSTSPIALPVVSAELANSEEIINPVIEGSLTEESAKVLGLQINSGVLPVQLEIGKDSVRYDPLLSLDYVYKVLKYISLGLVIIFAILLVWFRSSAFIGEIYFLFYALALGAFLRIAQIPLGTHTLIGTISLLFCVLLQLIAIIFKLKECLKKGKPFNLAIFQATHFGDNFVNFFLLLLGVLALLGTIFNIFLLRDLSLVVLAGITLFFIVKRTVLHVVR